jgi:hypothetical protein
MGKKERTFQAAASTVAQAHASILYFAAVCRKYRTLVMALVVLTEAFLLPSHTLAIQVVILYLEVAAQRISVSIEVGAHIIA